MLRVNILEALDRLLTVHTLTTIDNSSPYSEVSIAFKKLSLSFVRPLCGSKSSNHGEYYTLHYVKRSILRNTLGDTSGEINSSVSYFWFEQEWSYYFRWNHCRPHFQRLLLLPFFLFSISFSNTQARGNLWCCCSHWRIQAAGQESWRQVEFGCILGIAARATQVQVLANFCTNQQINIFMFVYPYNVVCFPFKSHLSDLYLKSLLLTF